MPDILKLSELDTAAIPAELKPSWYFDFEKHPFAHKKLFEEANTVTEVLDNLGTYIQEQLIELIQPNDKVILDLTEKDFPNCSSGLFSIKLEADAEFKLGFITGSPDTRHTLYLARGAKCLGANFWLERGSVYIGENSLVEAGAGIKSNVLLGANNQVLQGAYLRDFVLTGDKCTLRLEIKNSALLDEGMFPHPGYLGDSLCGFQAHFGNQATSANFGILNSSDAEPKAIAISLRNKRYNLGRSKIGIIMGDNAQLGCNAVSDPGTFLGPGTIVYSLSRINKGFYGPYELIKNKPMQKGIIERIPLR